jgi:hypothetical protein
MKYTLFAIIILLSISSCSRKENNIIFLIPYSSETINGKYPKSKSAYEIQFNNVKNANPNSDFQKALQKNDYRFIGISGQGYLIPGIEEGTINILVKKHGFKIIAGTSDKINLGYPPLQSIAYNYAEKYNSDLLKYFSNIEK